MQTFSVNTFVAAASFNGRNVKGILFVLRGDINAFPLPIFLHLDINHIISPSLQLPDGRSALISRISDKVTWIIAYKLNNK
jgi:hypothetical protein